MHRHALSLLMLVLALGLLLHEEKALPELGCVPALSLLLWLRLPIALLGGGGFSHLPLYP